MIQAGIQSNVRKILIVDDTEPTLSLLVDIVSLAGHSAIQANTGEMALSLATANLPDLIMLDIKMPVMDGFEVCRILKSNPLTSDIPIIFLSGNDDPDAKLQGFALGAADYITKPYHPAEVLARVNTQIKLRKLNYDLEELVKARTKQLEAEIDDRIKVTNELVTSRQKLRELSWHMENVREEERKHIARELHDELGQILSSLRIDLTQLASQASIPLQEIRKKLQTAIERVNEVADIARLISENLRPGTLDTFGLAAAVEHHVKHFMANTGLYCKLTMNRDQFSIDPKKETIAVKEARKLGIADKCRAARARDEC